MKSVPTLLLLALLVAPAQADPDLTAEVDAWHAGRIERLRQPDGWLSLVGLIALPEGRSSFGTGSDVDLHLDAPGPEHIGDVIVEGADVDFVPAAPVTVDGEPIERVRLAPDISGDPTVLQVGTVSFYLIMRHERPYFRVRDANAPLIERFEGIERWPVDEAWRIRAQWVEYDTPQLRQFPDVLGVAETAEVEGEARFEIDGRTFTLYPNGTGEDWMYWVFGDATNGLSTYGGGRFLYSDLPDSDGTLILDFNRAYNPPCVFTPYATCPLPADGNAIDVEVTAGEKMYGDAH